MNCFPLRKRSSRVSTAAALFGSLALASLSPSLWAQEGNGNDEDIYDLPTFEVKAPGDFGYRKTTAVTAARMNVPILETPLNINVVADEFLDDTGVSNLVDAFDYTSSINTNPDELLRNDGILVRGFQAGFVLRDGFKKYYAVNLDGVDRIEVVKGPVSVFYGLAEPGGVINYVTKRPLFNQLNEVKFEYGQDEHRKAYVDSTGPIIKDKLAYRVLGTYLDSESWKDFVTWERKYILSSLTYRPFDGVNINLAYEYDDSFRTGGIRTALVHNSGYYDDYYERPYDYGYFVDWNAKNRTLGPNAVQYNIEQPQPNANFPDGQVRYPYSGVGGVNPRWVGSGVDQSIFPEQQRNIPVPYQYRMISVDGAGGEGIGNVAAARTYARSWRIQKILESNFQEDPGRYDGNFFPFGYDYNPNGPYAVNIDESHIVTAELQWDISENWKFRYGFNYLENYSFQRQQYNSDPDMDGATLNQVQGIQPGRFLAGRYFPPSTAIGGAALVEFVNKYYTHQMEMSYTIEIGQTSHTFTALYEYRDDAFTQFSHNSSRTYYDMIQAGVQGVGIVDIYVDDFSRYDTWDGGRTLDQFPNASSTDIYGSNATQIQEGVGANYRGKFFDDHLQTLVGIRHEQQNQWDVGWFDGAKSNPRDLTGTVPTFGAIYRLPGAASDFVLYASYSESFSARGNNETNSPYTLPDPENPNAGTITIDPELLDDETGLGYEGGIKTEFKDNLINGAMSVFHLEKDNIIVVDQGAVSAWEDAWEESTLPRPAIPRIYRNSGLNVTEGVEVDLILTPKPNWQITLAGSWLFTREIQSGLDYGNPNVVPGSDEGPWPIRELYVWDSEMVEYQVVDWDDGSATYEPIRYRAEVGENGETNYIRDSNGDTGAWRPKTQDEIQAWEDENGPMPYEPVEWRELAAVPEFTFATWSKYDFVEGPLTGFSFGIGARYQSKTRPSQNRRLDFYNEAFIRFDGLLRYSYTFSDDSKITVSLNVNNLLDERVVRGGNFGVTDPRTWKLTVGYKF